MLHNLYRLFIYLIYFKHSTWFLITSTLCTTVLNQCPSLAIYLSYTPSLCLFLASCIRCTYQQKFCFHFISHVPHYCCCCCYCGCWNGPFSLSGANDAPKTATGDEQLKRTNQNQNPPSKSKSEDSKIKKSFMARLHHNNNNSKVQLTGPKAALGAGKWARSCGESINSGGERGWQTKQKQFKYIDKLSISCVCVPRGAN